MISCWGVVSSSPVALSLCADKHPVVFLVQGLVVDALNLNQCYYLGFHRLSGIVDMAGSSLDHFAYERMKE